MRPRGRACARARPCRRHVPEGSGCDALPILDARRDGRVHEPWPVASFGGEPMTALLGVAIPLAHAGHVLIELPIYLGPVVVVVVWLKIADWRQKRSGKRRSSN